MRNIFSVKPKMIQGICKRWYWVPMLLLVPVLGHSNAINDVKMSKLVILSLRLSMACLHVCFHSSFCIMLGFPHYLNASTWKNSLRPRWVKRMQNTSNWTNKCFFSKDIYFSATFSALRFVFSSWPCNRKMLRSTLSLKRCWFHLKQVMFTLDVPVQETLTKGKG